MPKQSDCRSFRLPPRVSGELDEVADQLGMTVSEFIRDAVEKYLRVLKKKGLYVPQACGEEVVSLRN